MVAATKDRDTQETGSRSRGFGMAAGARIFAGTMVGLNAAGTAQPMGLLAATPKCAGVALAAFDNTGGAANAVTAEVHRGIVAGPFANSSAGDLIAATDIDADCFAVDDQTVAKTNGTSTRAVAGKVHQVDSRGVWVRFA
jgi:hypothetical protein